MIDILTSNFKFHFPSIADKTVEYKDLGRYELLVFLDDGSRLLYDDVEHAIRGLHYNKENISEADYTKEFKTRLRRMMRYRDITQSELAEKSGLSTRSISSYVNGRAIPSSYNLDRLAFALNCDTDDLTYID